VVYVLILWCRRLSDRLVNISTL